MTSSNGARYLPVEEYPYYDRKIPRWGHKIVLNILFSESMFGMLAVYPLAKNLLATAHEVDSLVSRKEEV